MAYLEGILVWAAIGLYSFSFLLFLSGLVFKKDFFLRWGYIACLAGFAAHTGSIISRWAETGHLPVMMTYENSLFGTWFIVLTYIVMRRAFPLSRPFAVAVLPLAVLILGNGIQAGAELQPLEPPYKSNWLYVHVLFAWFAFSSYVTAFSAGIMYLLKARAKKGLLSRLPELKLLDELSFRLILFGFFSEAIMIGSGAIWAHGLWGRYWGWDPVETWSLISWLAYGLNIHLRITLGWSGKRAAWLAIGSLFGVIFLFFGLGYISEVHTSIF
ncbi:MAG: cytochrome c biogenesis protein CcsA [Thermodesulfovibrionales bacterium]|nr:cytochrome c biogenesis protein CcsA [Thermodesulfovibrionales bacterium]